MYRDIKYLFRDFSLTDTALQTGQAGGQGRIVKYPNP
jgi:hypothetical protein